MQETGTLRRKTEDDVMEVEEDLPDENIEEEIFHARLKKLTAERNIYNFRSLSQEESDVLAFNKGADVIDKPEKKKKKRKNRRSEFHLRRETRSQSFQERN